jgi:hypothetical protein
LASTDAKPVPQKNVAYRVTFPILDADGDLVTGATALDSEVSKDGGTFADCTNEATEIATASGVYFLDLTSTEMNADTVAVIGKTTSVGAKTTTIVMYPEEAGDIRVNVTAYGGTAGTFSAGRPEVNASHAGGTAWGSGAITAASIAADAITDAKVAADVTIASVTGAVGSVTGAVGSVTGAVGSVTGNVGGNVVGSVASVTAGVTLAASAVQAIWDALTTALTTVGSIGKLLVDNVNATISSRATPAQVNAEVVDALATDTYAEPGQGTPAATASLAAKIGYLFKAWRNKSDQTATLYQLYNDDALTVDQKATVSDDATTFVKGEVATGP